MAEPKSVAPKCDVPGCNMPASLCTDGTEKDVQSIREPGDPRPAPAARPALKNINICLRHANWPHSDDAKVFAAMSPDYKARK